jgi:hypothetical protein
VDFFYYYKIPKHSKREQTAALRFMASELMLFWESQLGLAVCKQATEAKQVQGYNNGGRRVYRRKYGVARFVRTFHDKDNE